MVYRDRKYLSILTLTEDRDYVTDEELICALEEGYSNAVYIERDGILCGLITSGRIVRRRDEKTRRVLFNKRYTYVYPEEYWRARQIFKNKKNINVLPIVSKEGRLMGDYVRWDDLICTDHIELLCRDPYVLQDLKADVQNVVFVKPVVHGGGCPKTSKRISQWQCLMEAGKEKRGRKGRNWLANEKYQAIMAINFSNPRRFIALCRL